MSYTIQNFKSKKELKEAVKCSLEVQHEKAVSSVRCFNPGFGPDLSNYTGTVYLEGPHYPQPHKWYAQAEMKDGIVIKVK